MPMALPLAQWLETPEIKRFSKMDPVKAGHEYFFRNPPRVIWSDQDFVSSPADGVIVTQGRFSPDDDLIEVMGAKVTVTNVLGATVVDSPSLVISVFMTAADVHWNRLPTTACMTRYELDPIRTSNLPMLWTEMGLLDAGLIRRGTFGFMTANQRVVNKCFCGHLDYTYWLVQIADSDVDKIVPLKTAKVNTYNQNERFGQIIWGSMCVLVLPLDSRYRFRPTHKTGVHVEAGVDPLVKVERIR